MPAVITMNCVTHRTRLAVLLAAALVPALASCSAGDQPADPADSPSASDAAVDDGSLAGSGWEGTLDGNNISLRLEDDGTVLVERYNGTGPFDVDEDVWDERDGVLVITLTGLYVQGDEPRVANVTVRGEIDDERLELVGEYSDGAPASMHLSASVS